MAVDTQSSLVVVKSFNYRGQTREYSSRYHTNGPLTITAGQFVTLADAVVADEAAATSDACQIVRVDWADASTATSTNPHGFVTHSKAYTTGGAIDATGRNRCPGDCATFIRYSTTQRTSKNHPIYLFSYFHGVMNDGNTTKDQLAAAMKTALEEYGDDWLAGFSDGTNTHVRCGPRGAVAQTRIVPVYITHRDFPN